VNKKIFNFKRNANVSIVILVLLVFILFVAVIISFFGALKNVDERFVSVVFVEELAFRVEVYEFYKDFWSKEELEENLGYREEEGKNFLEISYSKAGFLGFGEEKLVVSVRYYLD